jgi:hypothetical protein
MTAHPVQDSKGFQRISGPSRRRFQTDWASLFIAALRSSGLVAPAARAAGVGRRTVYDRREQDERFAAAWDDALEATRRARIAQRTNRRPV